MPHPAAFKCSSCRRELGTVRTVGAVSLLAVGSSVRNLAVDQGRFGIVCSDCESVRPWTGGVVYATSGWTL